MSPPGGGRGGWNKGPQLPWLLQQQVGGGSSSGSRGGRGGSSSGSRGHSRGGFSAGRGRGSAGFSRGSKTPGRGSSRPTSRKELRKAARQEKRHHRFEVQQQQAQQRHTLQQQQQVRQQHAGGKRPVQHVEAAAAPASQPSKRQKLEHQQQQQQQPKLPMQQQQQPQQQQRPLDRKHIIISSRAGAAAPAGGHSSSKTKFYEMLEADGITAAAAASGAASKQAFLADLRLEREMARKLKVKKGKALSGPEDGLDALLSGITAGSSQLPAGIDPAAAAAADGDTSDDGDDNRHAVSSDGGDDTGDDSESDGDLGFAGFMDDDDDESAQGEEGEGSEGLEADDENGSEGLSDDDEGFSEHGEDEEEGFSADDEEGLPGFDQGGSSSEDAEGEGEGEEGSSEDEDAAAAATRRKHGSSNSSSSGSEEDDDDDDEDTQPAAAAAGPKAAALAPDAAAPGAAKYVPPALRRTQQAAAAAGGGGGGGVAAADGLAPAVQRRVTGLLNRLAESNLQAICRDILTLYETEGRRLVADAVSAGLLAAVAEGPRATEQFAAVAAVFVGGLAAGARAQDVSARFLEMLVARLQQAYAADDGLACHNLIMLLAYCYSAGIVAADCMYSVLGELTRRFAESDVAMMLTLLNAVGLQLRAADPVAMKDFVLAVHNRAAAAGPGGLTKRAEIMLELVVDIKNNRARDVKAGRTAAAAASGGSGKSSEVAAAQNVGGGRGGAAAVLQQGLLKWLKASGVDDITLANISWAKLVQPNKKGMWWHPAATDAAAGLLPGLLAEHMHSSSAAAAAAAAAADSDDDYEGAGSAAGAGAGASAAQLLQLAAGMRMTTDARRAAFVAIMGSEDCADACEKLLRLPLKGDQSREVVRVLVECCLQESRYNPYYGHLAARLAAVSKSHKVTLQYCIWDQWKEVAATPPRRLLCLAGLVGHLLGCFVLPLSIVKPIDFDACGTWTSKETFLWRHTLQQLLTSFASDADAESAFSRLAQQQALGALCKALGLFLKLRVGPWLVAQADAGLMKQQTLDSCLLRLARAEKLLLSSTAAVLAG